MDVPVVVLDDPRLPRSRLISTARRIDSDVRPCVLDPVILLANPRFNELTPCRESYRCAALPLVNPFERGPKCLSQSLSYTTVPIGPPK